MNKIRQYFQIIVFWSFLTVFLNASSADSLISYLACGNCHLGVQTNLDIKEVTPDLSNAGLRYRPAYLFEFLQTPKQIRHNIGAARMPGFHFDEEEALAVTLFLMEQRSPEVLPKILDQSAERGVDAEKIIREDLQCTSCHGLNGSGQNNSTDLTDVGMRLQEDWLREYLTAPHLFDGDDTQMPSFFYQYSQADNQLRPISVEAPVRLSKIVGYLTLLKRKEANQASASFNKVKEQLPHVTAEMGRDIILSQNCHACHTLDRLTPWFPRNGPDLSIESQRVQRGWLIGYLSQSHAVRPFGYFPGSGSRMPDFRLTEDEVAELTSFFKKGHDDKSGRKQQELSAFSKTKALTLLRDKLSCLGCHRLDGFGGMIGPDLSSTSSRLNAPFVDMMILHPRMLVPESIMPKVPLSPETATLIGSYLKGTLSSQEQHSYLSLVDHQPYNPKESIYREFCSGCHGLDGGGDGFNAAYLPKRPISHSDKSLMSEKPDDVLYDGIYSGGAILESHHFMPPWGETFSPYDVKKLVEEIRQLCQCEGPNWSQPQ